MISGEMGGPFGRDEGDPQIFDLALQRELTRNYSDPAGKTAGAEAQSEPEATQPDETYEQLTIEYPQGEQS
jgi:hypothetical protein